MTNGTERNVVLIAKGDGGADLHSLASNLSGIDGCDGLSPYYGHSQERALHLARTLKDRMLMVVAGLSGNLDRDKAFVSDIRDIVGELVHIVSVLDLGDDDEVPSSDDIGAEEVVVSHDIVADIAEEVQIAKDLVAA
jgi:hypothetical protein